MKIASFKAGPTATYGLVTNAGIIDAGKRLKNWPTLKALLANGSLDALKALHVERILKNDEYRVLLKGYLFLRRLDHRLRLERDQSIDAFEAEPGRLDGIAKALGYDGNQARKRKSTSGEKLLREYQASREKIRACYARHFLSK